MDASVCQTPIEVDWVENELQKSVVEGRVGTTETDSDLFEDSPLKPCDTTAYQ